MNNKTFRDHISQQCGFPPTKEQRLAQNKARLAVQVCNAGDWPDRLPQDFESWLRSNNDAIDIGGNEIPDRIAANLDAYGNENLPF